MLADISLQSLLDISKRINKSVISAINSSHDIEIVNTRYKYLKELWISILSRYEKGRRYESDFEYSAQWIDKVQESFEGTEILRQRYNKTLQSAKLLHESQLCLKRDLYRLKGSQDVAKQSLEDYKGILEQMISKYDCTNNSNAIIEGTYREYKEQRQQLQRTHIEYLSALKSSTEDNVFISVEEDWLTNVLCNFKQLDEDIRTVIYGRKESDTEQYCGLKLEKISLPSFNGNIRDYPKFRSDFNNYVLPRLHEKDVPYVLKNCLVGKAHELIKNVEEDAKVIWQRIEDKYGRPSKIVDEVIFDITRFRTLRDDDRNEFIEFVSVIETAMVDLKRVNLENEIANSYVISEVEKRLPPIIRREWSYAVVISDSRMGASERFTALLSFLIEQRNGLEYLSSRVRCSPNKTDVSTESKNAEQDFQCGYLDISVGENGNLGICSTHKTKEHYLGNCNTFKRATARDKIRSVIKARACWNCLVPGHKARHCFKQKHCTIKGCTFWHHELLHEAHYIGERFGGSE